MAELAERQLEAEGARRVAVGAAAVVGGALLFGGALWAAIVEAKSPTVGLLQGLAPALSGHAAASVDPRTAQEHFLISHQLSLIVAFVLSAAAAALMIVPLSYLAQAERVRSATPSAITTYLARYAPLMLALFVPAYEISQIIGAHTYLDGAARTAAAYTSATGGSIRTALLLLGTLGGLAVAATFVLISLRSMRVGLLTRLMGGVGILSGILFLIPLTPLPVVQALWLVFVGAMLLQFGGRALPEAWTVLEARPWPSPPPRERSSRGRQPRGARAAAAAAPPPPAPEPALPRGGSDAASKKRKRRR
jgi:hypothetical protein